MSDLIIQINPSAGESSCTLCEQPMTVSAGPGLARSDGLGPVCRSCGCKHDPALTALLDLARVAQRIGTLGRHTVTPPFGALLDLAQAAENYAQIKVENPVPVA